VPLVHVHGVGTRLSQAYERQQAHRSALYRAIVVPALCRSSSDLTVLNPYWGGSAASFAWNHASLPADEAPEKSGRGSAEAIGAEWLAEAALNPSSKGPLSTLARESIEYAVDLLWAVAMDRAGADEADALARLAAGASALADRNGP